VTVIYQVIMKPAGRVLETLILDLKLTCGKDMNSQIQLIRVSYCRCHFGTMMLVVLLEVSHQSALNGFCCSFLFYHNYS